MKQILAWTKKHIVATIIIGVVAVGFLLNMNSDFSNDNFLNKTFSSKTLPNGTYSCELMYNGKSLDDDDVIRAFIQKLATYDSSIDVDKVNISDFRKGLFDEFGTAYIVKENNIVKLNLTNGSHKVEFALYNISNNQFNLSKDWFDTDNENALNTMETAFNNFVSVKQTKDSFTYGNFGFILIIPTIYNNSKNNISSDGTIDIDYTKYTDLGDLVCGSNVNSSNLDKPIQEQDSNNKYLGKYIGVAEFLPEMSYIELYNNNKAKLSINNCEGFSIYDATYKIKYDEDLASDMLYITSLTIYDGWKFEMPDTLMFRIEDDELIVLNGYDGNLFDCSRTTKLVKSN